MNFYPLNNHHNLKHRTAPSPNTFGAVHSKEAWVKPSPQDSGSKGSIIQALRHPECFPLKVPTRFVTTHLETYCSKTFRRQEMSKHQKNLEVTRS